MSILMCMYVYISSSRHICVYHRLETAAALSDGRADGVDATWSRDGAIAATTSCAEHFRQIGPNGPKIENETTHDLLSRRRFIKMA